MPVSLKLDISPAVIDWALRYVRNSRTEKKLLLWKSGDKKPTLKQIEELSRELHLPFANFLLPAPLPENIPLLEYRTIESLELSEPSRELVDTIQHMARVQDWMHDYLLSNASDKLPFVGCLSASSNEKETADTIRATLEINANWQKHISKDMTPFNFFRERIENIGVVVMINGIVANNTHRALDSGEFRAFAMINDYAPLIFINSNDSESGKLFSLLHEAAHIFLGSNSLFNANDIQNISNPVEKLCNSVAAEILVPKDIFVSAWQTEQDSEAQIDKLSKEFKCSTIVIARRALDSRLINKELYDAVYNTSREQYLASKERQKQQGSGGDYYNVLKSRISGNFFATLENALCEGKVTYTDAYRLTNTNGKTFNELIKTIRGVDYIK